MKYLRYLFNYLLSLLYDVYYFFFGDIRSRVQNIKYYQTSKAYPGYLKKGNMAEAVKSLALFYCQGKGLDIGAGKWALTGSRPIENSKEENAYKISEPDNSCNFVFSSHSLEHLSDWENALQEWFRVLKTDGVIFLYLPHPVCEMWHVGVNKQHLWAPDSELCQKFLVDKLKMKIELATTLPDGYLSFVVVARKV